TDVSVPAGLARRIGLERGMPLQTHTANGTITTYRTRLASVVLGDIELGNVRASINPHMQGDEVLLGMSFLRNLELVQRDRTLTLRQFPR
ncbi:MAG: retropepsin-like aspartic protease family protein, partial [Gammaproteobacteria bacterium]